MSPPVTAFPHTAMRSTTTAIMAPRLVKTASSSGGDMSLLWGGMYLDVMQSVLYDVHS